MQNTEIMGLASTISHLHAPTLESEELRKTNKRRNKRKNGKNLLFGNDNNE